MPVKKVLAVNIYGDMTYCSAPEDMRGKRRCNHIAHQETGETAAEFIQRAEEIQKNWEPSQEKFIPDEGTEIETKPYRMTDEEKAKLTHIENKFQLDIPLEDGGYITTEECLWNDMDKKYFASKMGMSVAQINSVLHQEANIVVESDNPKFPIGKVVPLDKELPDGVEVDTGVQAMNDVSEDNGFEATKDIYVLPYYMRQGTAEVDSDITLSYKYLLRSHNDVNKQQEAYEALLNNKELEKDKRRNNGKWAKKSLADEFTGKGGIFRGYLEGGSIPYSGRAVITPTTDMNYGEIKIPPTMAVDIYKPTIIKELTSRGMSYDDIEKWTEKYRDEQTSISDQDIDELSSIISNSNVRAIMNRQPSLHTSSLQSFKPLISRNATVQIHPIYCKAFGADYDGDTVSVIGINSGNVSEIADRSIGARNKINTNIPRSQDKSSIQPSKDALFGLMSIIERVR